MGCCEGGMPTGGRIGGAPIGSLGLMPGIGGAPTSGDCLCSSLIFCWEGGGDSTWLCTGRCTGGMCCISGACSPAEGGITPPAGRIWPGGGGLIICLGWDCCCCLMGGGVVCCSSCWCCLVMSMGLKIWGRTGYCWIVCYYSGIIPPIGGLCYPGNGPLMTGYPPTTYYYLPPNYCCYCTGCC